MNNEKKEESNFRENIRRDQPVVMPQAPAIEKSLLSMMVVDPINIISRCIADGMTEDFFYIPAHRILWEIICSRYEKNESVDITSIDQAVSDAGRLEAVGSHAGLVDVLSFSTSTALFESHFGTLKEKYLRRTMIAAANSMHELAHSEEMDINQILDTAEQEVMQIRNSSAQTAAWSLKEDINAVMDNMTRLIQQKGQVQGLPTGYPKLDENINGLKPGELFVIAARPSMGKTSFLLNIVEHIVLNEKKPVLVFSCEMPSVQLVERLLYARSGVSKKELAAGAGSLTRDKHKSLARAIEEYRKSQLIIDDTAAISISELRAKARRVLMSHPDLGAIGVDYLQLMRSHTKQALNSREREIAEISGGLKSLAKELKLPVIVLAQLNRGPENRTGKSKGLPMMSDLRESGAIEQDADMIGLLYRSAYYAEDDAEKEKVGDNANLVLAKNRNGPTGNVPLSFHAELMRFVPREPSEDEMEDS